MNIYKIKRSDKIASLLKNEISVCIKDDRFDRLYSLVSISRVKVSNDVKNAKVYIIDYSKDFKSPDDNLDMIQSLNSNVSVIKGMLAKSISMKYMVDFKFFHDQDYIESDKINKIIDNL